MPTVAELERRIERLEDSTVAKDALNAHRELWRAELTATNKEVAEMRLDIKAIRSNTTWLFRLFATFMSTVAAGVLIFFITKAGG